MALGRSEMMPKSILDPFISHFLLCYSYKRARCKDKGRKGLYKYDFNFNQASRDERCRHRAKPNQQIGKLGLINLTRFGLDSKSAQGFDPQATQQTGLLL